MATFNDLRIDQFYLVKVSESDQVTIIQVAMATEKCVFIYQFAENDTSFWKKKEDTIFEIIEEMSDEAVEQYEGLLLEEFEDFDDEAAGLEDGGEDGMFEFEELGEPKKKKKKKK